MSGNITAVGDSILVGIDEDGIRKTEKPACVIEFDSVDELRAFMKDCKSININLFGREQHKEE